MAQKDPPFRYQMSTAISPGRRRFLRLSALSAAGVVLARPAARAARSPANTGTWDVLVVGGGLAGMTAASRLRAAGLRPLVLEARNRIGGRIQTVTDWPGPPVDLGTSWINDASANPLTAVARHFGLPTINTPFQNSVYRQQTGPLLSPAQTADAEARFFALLAFLETYAETLQSEGQPDVPLAQGISAFLAAQSPPLTLDEMRELNVFISFYIELAYGAETSGLSLYNYAQGGSATGITNLIFPQGFAQVVRALARGVQFVLGTVASEIAYDDGGVRVTTNRGVYRAQQAVVTVPASVLKSGTIRFVPELPAAKQASLARLGIASVTKFYLLFERTFWDQDPTFIYRISETPNQWVTWTNFAPFLNRPVLLAYLDADFAQQAESMSDPTLVAEVTRVLRNIYGARMPVPYAHLRSNWATDPYALGAFTNLPPGASGEDYNTLGAPIGDRLFFAGDGTSSVNPNSVNGAYTTGVQAAQAILRSRS